MVTTQGKFVIIKLVLLLRMSVRISSVVYEMVKIHTQLTFTLYEIKNIDVLG